MLRRLLVLALPALLALGLVVAPAPAPAEERYPEPVLAGNVGDPSVVAVGKKLVVVATGEQVDRAVKEPGRGWRWTEPVLAERPAWARAGAIWAADLARVGKRWVLYFAVPVRGLGPEGRCIGVAVARGPLEVFRPVGTAPLVCPARAKVPAAADPVAVPGLPSRGVIDPSAYTEGGRHYLLYKTDGKPSSIRLLPLSGNGRTARGASVELIRSTGVVENPVLVRTGGSYYLFTSEGDFARCSYHQTWRRSRSLTAWAAAPQGVLLDRASTGGLCGPGGGDVVVQKGRATLYFHGWVRRSSTIPKGAGFWGWNGGEQKARRAMYAARLTIRSGVPVVKRYLR
ncbi:family 43 glycosylhydrolase [Pimelobacter simplex]|uniref:Family 43 glycosylhydrolase n=1 Tax=Nocardioides simplex TaxID=2045 RepID=A0A7J5E2G5_NOCSI|nr:family 43 glycosylhydrolase [Pimelobacter simplex]KAB2812462.1 family 43 glycosylhydrolase [Pimelobacter simplex]